MTMLSNALLLLQMTAHLPRALASAGLRTLQAHVLENVQAIIIIVWGANSS